MAIALLAAPVVGYGVLPPQPLDRLLGGDSRFNCRSVLHVTFERLPSPPRRTLSTGPPDVRIEISVRSVILGADYRVGQRETLQVGSFQWPHDLVPLSGGEGVLIFLRGRALCSVLPTRSDGFETAKDRDAAKTLIAADLLATLASERSAEKRRMTIRTVERILGPADVGRLSPYLEDEDRWVRWAALAALVRLTKDAGLLSRAAVEMGEVLGEMSSDRSLRQRRFLLFDHFHYLVQSDRLELVDPEFLPLLRAVARTSRRYPQLRWEFGIGALCRMGTIDDAGILFAYHQDEFAPRGRPGQAGKPGFRGDYHHRRKVVLGLARILGVEIPAR